VIGVRSAAVSGYSRKRLTVVIAHDKAGVQFLDRPGRRQAAGIIGVSLIAVPSCIKKIAISAATKPITIAKVVQSMSMTRPEGV
jgi:hypothetical protein